MTDREAIHKAISLAAEIWGEMQAMNDKLSCLQLLIDQLDSSIPSKDLVALQRRLDRIREHKNAMELGSLKLEINRAMEAAWQRL